MWNLAGEVFGRWTVMNDRMIAPNGERKWLCRCSCGTERYVLERSLIYGGSKSCGCLRKEEATAAIAHDLAGQTFGELTVLRKAETQRKNGGIRWRCLCSCGKELDVPATLLVTGKKTSCGCKTQKNYYSADIAGMRFHRLTALYPTEKRSQKGSVVWHCRCDCGNEVDVSYNELVYSNMKSCGCQKKEHDQVLSSFLTHVEGTSIEKIKSRKIPSNNTTGYKGVYFIKGKYVAKIVFQKKPYYLGSYDTLEEAVQARRNAEAVLFDGFLDFYERWKERADADPDWGRANPISIRVIQENKELSVRMYPELESKESPVRNDFCREVCNMPETRIANAVGYCSGAVMLERTAE